MIDDSSMLMRPGNLVASEIDGETVVMNISTGAFFQLNGMGSRIWEALATPMTLAELCRKMQHGHDVDTETCRRDVTDFVTLLSGRELLTVAPPA